MQAITGNEPEVFEAIETLEPYSGYYFNMRDVLLTCLLGSVCVLRNVLMIWKCANSHAVEMSEYYNICLPSRSQFYLLLSNIDPASMKKNFTCWAGEMLGELTGYTVALDGKTFRSTEKMANFDRPLHIVTAFVSELGMTIGSEDVDGKTNEIPTVQKLLEMLEIKGSVVVADAMHCQTETARIIRRRGAMETSKTLDKNGGRIEKRTAYITDDIEWLTGKEKWVDLRRIGAICTKTEYRGRTSVEWRYYITSKPMSAKELLYRAWAEWGVESLHGLMDVHFSEDHSTSNNKNVLENLNITRKMALNLARAFRDTHAPKESIS